jgi:hypothetical protein
MSNAKPTRRREKGIAIILACLTLLVTMPIAGLAVDLSMLYFIQTKLSTALDSAVLAGARALGSGSTPALQTSNAQAAAQSYFSANFPTGFWHTTNLSFSPPAVSTAVPHYRTITASASVQAPLYFLRILGQSYSTVTASAQSSRRDAVVMLVLDRSSSMNYAMNGTTACAMMVADATAFLSNFAEGRDSVGLVVFGSSTYYVAPSTNFTSLTTLIPQVVCGGNTATASALNVAYTQLKTAATTSTANVIVLMTDGRPNGIDGNFTTLRLNPGSCDSSGAALTGVLAQWAGGPYDTGSTAGLMKDTNTNIAIGNNEVAAGNSTGCYFPSNLANVSKDLYAIPPKDIFGNTLATNYSVLNSSAPYDAQAAILTSVTDPRQIIMASTNAADNQATAIRLDPTYNISIYCIGLEGTSPTDPPDTLLLQKIANDPSMQNSTNPTAQSFYTLQQGQPAGYFALAPDPTQLGAAFSSIASQIVIRLSN